MRVNQPRVDRTENDEDEIILVGSVDETPTVSPWERYMSQSESRHQPQSNLAGKLSVIGTMLSFFSPESSTSLAATNSCSDEELSPLQSMGCERSIGAYFYGATPGKESPVSQLEESCIEDEARGDVEEGHTVQARRSDRVERTEASPHETIWSSLTRGTKPRSGSKMWSFLKKRQDSILLEGEALTNERGIVSELFRDEDEEERKARLREAATKEIRNRLELKVTHCLVAIAIYLLFGMLAYCLVFEAWGWVDALYFSVVTFCTVGYGDIVPTNNWSRIFTCVYALGGIGFLGVALGVVGSKMLDAQVQAIEKASDLAKVQAMSVFEYMSSPLPSQRKQDMMSCTGESETSLKSELCSVSNDPHCRHHQPSPSWKRFIEFLPVAVFLSVASYFVWKESGWDVVSTIYFCVVTGTTVGYGDLTPVSTLGKGLAVIFIPLAVVCKGEWLARMASSIIEARQAEIRKSFQARELTIHDLELMDLDGNGRVSRADYIIFMLLAMNKVDQECLDDLGQQFDRLDHDGNGTLDKNDLLRRAKQRLKDPKRKLELASYKRRLLRLASTASRVRGSIRRDSAASSMTGAHSTQHTLA